MPHRSLILALDQGTTSSRAVLVDDTGAIRGTAAQELTQSYPQPAWVEHDPIELWESQQIVMKRVLAGVGASAADVAAIGITNQRETTLLWRRSDGQPLHPAIVWQDRRTALRCARLLEEGRAARILDRTGLLPDPYFSATKLEWLLQQVPGARAAAEAGELAFGTVDAWLLWNLTGGAVHATDRTNASRTLLWNLREERWDADLLHLFDVPRSVLPQVHGSTAQFGETADGIPICGVAGDQQAALFGQAGWDPGAAKNTYGTGCFLLSNVGDAAPPPAGLLTTAACGPGGRDAYALEGSVFIAGAAVQWLRDGLELIHNAAISEAIACSVTDSGGVYVVPAFTGLGAPHWDPNARGTIVGLTRGTGRAHLVRATLESIAFQVMDVVDAMAAEGVPLRSLRVDGGASANDFLMQFQADLLNIPVERSAVRETTALGAAYLAGLGCGLWKQADLDHFWHADRVFEPHMSRERRAELRAGWQKAVERAKDWASP